MSEAEAAITSKYTLAMTKLRKTIIFGLFLGAASTIVELDLVYSKETNSVPSPALKIDHLNSLNGLLFELAAERHAIHSKGPLVWLFTFHRDSNEIEKFSDGKYVVVSLPAELEENEVGLCVYMHQYNDLTGCDMDALARKGQFADALKYYDILLHFDRCGGPSRENAQKKRDYLTKIVQKEDVEENKRKYFELCYPLAGHLNFSEIERMKPTIVTNLLTLEIP